jgi:hypothetical protein
MERGDVRIACSEITLHQASGTPERKRTVVSAEWIAVRLQMGHPSSVSRQVGTVKSDRKLQKRINHLEKMCCCGTDPNGANLRVVWDDFIHGFLVARAMADFDHLMPGNIQKLVRFRSSFHGSGFSSEWSAGNLVFGDQFGQVRNQTLVESG